MPYLNGYICSEVWIFEVCIPNELWDRSVLIWFDSLLWAVEDCAKIQYLPCIFWDAGMKFLTVLKSFVDGFPGRTIPCVYQWFWNWGKEKKLRLCFIQHQWNWGVSHPGVFKCDVLQLCEGCNREKRHSVIEIILKTGFKIILKLFWSWI